MVLASFAPISFAFVASIFAPIALIEFALMFLSQSNL